MANKRMFSKAIIQSVKFIKMPTSTQNLYFHLSMDADDEGIVEAFKVMRMINCSEDDLRILVAKGFIKILNEELLTWIVDWETHNVIRADRKVVSIYHDLLVKLLYNTELCQFDNQVSANPQPSDNQVTTKCLHSIVENSIVENSIGHTADALKLDDIPFEVKSSKKESIKKDVFNYNGFLTLEIEAINLWIDYKAEQKHIYKPSGLTALRNSLLKIKESSSIIDAINNSIANGYKGIFEVKQSNYQSKPIVKRVNVKDPFIDTITNRLCC